MIAQNPWAFLHKKVLLAYGPKDVVIESNSTRDSGVTICSTIPNMSFVPLDTFFNSVQMNEETDATVCTYSEKTLIAKLNCTFAPAGPAQLGMCGDLLTDGEGDAKVKVYFDPRAVVQTKVPFKGRIVSATLAATLNRAFLIDINVPENDKQEGASAAHGDETETEDDLQYSDAPPLLYLDGSQSVNASRTDMSFPWLVPRLPIPKTKKDEDGEPAKKVLKTKEVPKPTHEIVFAETVMITIGSTIFKYRIPYLQTVSDTCELIPIEDVAGASGSSGSASRAANKNPAAEAGLIPAYRALTSFDTAELAKVEKRKKLNTFVMN